jgi:hypothetical protein
MVPLTIILGIIMIWCFYFRFMKAYQSRKRLIWVEVLSHDDQTVPISRYQAKQNLQLVSEVTQKLRSYNDLFDKYWYRQREFQFIDIIQDGEKKYFSNEIDQTMTANTANNNEFKNKSESIIQANMDSNFQTEHERKEAQREASIQIKPSLTQ